MQLSKSMLTPKELSGRTGIPVGTLSNWRVLRKAGMDIGPRFVKISPGDKAHVRYLVSDVEEWEARLAFDKPKEDALAAQNSARKAQGTVVECRPADRTMLPPKELSERTGVRLDYLSNWRVRRNAGEEIGPRFVKAGRLVRYMLADVEEWERTRAVRDMEHPASTAPPSVDGKP